MKSLYNILQFLILSKVFPLFLLFTITVLKDICTLQNEKVEVH